MTTPTTVEGPESEESLLVLKVVPRYGPLGNRGVTKEVRSVC